jgi:hypothetical protein
MLIERFAGAEHVGAHQRTLDMLTMFDDGRNRLRAVAEIGPIEERASRGPGAVAGDRGEPEALIDGTDRLGDVGQF